jgi:cytoskeletal protein RodZ
MENSDAMLVPDDAVGVYLQKKRTSQNISLEEVSEATGISAGVLKTLESDDREQFPAEVYTKGFYKKYAEYLGLNPDEILSVYQQQSDRQGKTRGRLNLSTIVTLKGKEEGLFGEITRRLFLPVIIILCGVLLYWIYINFLSSYNLLDYFR